MQEKIALKKEYEQVEEGMKRTGIRALNTVLKQWTNRDASVAIRNIRWNFDKNKMCKERALRLMSRAVQTIAKRVLCGAVWRWKTGQMRDLERTLRVRSNMQMEQQACR